jgi:mycobactin peptide synthetase MbtE
VQYSDYAVWEASLLDESAGIAGPQRDYWIRQLDGLAVETGLRPDFPRPAVLSGSGDVVEFSFATQTRDKLAALSRDLGVTEFMLLQTAVAVVLHKAGGGADISLGTPVAGRGAAELDQLVGFFVNILVLRNDLRGNPTLRDLLTRTRDMALAAYAHQDLPFDQVVDAVRPVRSLARNPLFDVVVHVRDQVQASVVSTGADGDTTFSALEPTFDVAHADLSVNFFASADGYHGHLIYRTELYTRETVQRFADWLLCAIDAFADRPDQPLRDVEIVSQQEAQRILEFSNAGGDTARVYLLDESLKPVPVGVVGDLYCGGGLAVCAGLARPSLTATRFVADPFAAQPGSRLYRNGERGLWNADGRLELVTGLAGDHGTAPAAPTPVAGPAEPPDTATERALATILTDLLEAEQVGRNDDFFNLGGDSILAVRVAAQARDAGMPLTPRMVFEHPVLHELAAALDAKPQAEVEPDDTQHSPMSTSGLSADELAALTASWDQQ